MKWMILKNEENGPIFVWVMYPHRNEDPLEILPKMEEVVGDTEYALAAVQVDDWNSDLSPWEADTSAGYFAGNAGNTLTFIKEEVLPELRKKLGEDRKIYIIGYSLAGLFALWAAEKEDSFSGAASCSGSLWFPGWLMQLKQDTEFLKNQKVYLSLGGKEANTPDPLMKQVLVCTKEAEQILKSENQVFFEMNSGGHFADSGKRLAKAIKWLVL